MRIKRTFFYIRKNTNVPFFHERYNPDYCEEMSEIVKRIDSSLSFESGQVSERIHYFSLFHAHDDHDLFKLVTHNLYYEGDLKESFKESMRYTKKHEIAFALGISKLDHPLHKTYDLWEFCNHKPTAEVFIDATPRQKIALQLFNATVAEPNFLYIINFFDYLHNVKHVQVKMLDVEPDFWEQLFTRQKPLYPTFLEDKREYNSRHNIEQSTTIIKGLTDNQVYNYNTKFVNKYISSDLHNLSLPVLI